MMSCVQKDGFLKALRAVKEQGITYNDVKVTPYAALFNDKAAEQMAEQFGASYEDKMEIISPFMKHRNSVRRCCSLIRCTVKVY